MKSLSYLNKYFIKYKWRMLLGVIFIISSNYFGVQMPLFVQSTIDNVLSDVKQQNATSFLFVSLKIGGVYMLLSLGKGFFLFLTRQSIIITSRLIEYDLNLIRMHGVDPDMEKKVVNIVALMENSFLFPNSHLSHLKSNLHQFISKRCIVFTLASHKERSSD